MSIIVAGVVGFEPTIHDTKNRCLTTWLHPNDARLFTKRAPRLQGLICTLCSKNAPGKQRPWSSLTLW